MRISRKTLVIGSAGAALVAAGAWFLARPDILDVETVVVATRPLETVIEASGRTRVRERYLVVAPVSGRVERIRLDEGMSVHSGDVIARILPVPLDSEARMQARARIDGAAAIAIAAAGQARVATAALEQRRREQVRATRLVEAGAMAPRVAEEAQLALVDAEEQARGALQRSSAADADLRQARVVLDARDDGSAPVLVRAPASGRILRIPERSERIVAAGTPLVEIGDPRSIEVVADLLSLEVPGVAVGDRVRFPALATDGETGNALAATGRVSAIEPSGFTKISALGVEEQRVNVIIELGTVPLGLADGHRVDVAVIVWSAPTALAIPRSALVPAERGVWNAFILRNGTVSLRQVRIGHFGGADAEVLGGVAAGEEVVVFPSDRVRDGARAASQ